MFHQTYSKSPTTEEGLLNHTALNSASYTLKDIQDPAKTFVFPGRSAKLVHVHHSFSPVGHLPCLPFHTEREREYWLLSQTPLFIHISHCLKKKSTGTVQNVLFLRKERSGSMETANMTCFDRRSRDTSVFLFDWGVRTFSTQWITESWSHTRAPHRRHEKGQRS